MSVAQTHVGSTKNVAYLPFFKTDIAQTDGTLNTQATTEFYVAPSRGSVIGFSGGINGTLATGTLSFQPVIDGSLSPLFGSGSYIHTNQQYGYTMQDGRKDLFTFTAGQRLGVHFNADDTLEPNSSRDGAFLLVVLFEGVNY